MPKPTLTVLIDYKEQFYCAHKKTQRFTDLERTGALFAQAGIEQVVRRFEDLDFAREDFRDQPVWYQSSQDRGLHYKSFIEDVLLGLQLQGAVLLPAFHLFRAHHNKVFLEILRDLSGAPRIQRLRSLRFGTYEAFDRVADSLPYPQVLKGAAGDSGRAVRLVTSPRQARREARRLSYAFTPGDELDNLKKSIQYRDWVPHSRYRCKFIAQPFVPGLENDFRVQAYGHRDGPHYVVMRREIHPRSINASGGKGARTWPEHLPDGLLDLAEEVFQRFPAPFASMDLMHDGHDLYLGEVQYLRYGTYATTHAPHVWQRRDGAWHRVVGPRQWEAELVQAVIWYLEEQPWK